MFHSWRSIAVSCSAPLTVMLVSELVASLTSPCTWMSVLVTNIAPRDGDATVICGGVASLRSCKATGAMFALRPVSPVYSTSRSLAPSSTMDQPPDALDCSRPVALPLNAIAAFGNSLPFRSRTTTTSGSARPGRKHAALPGGAPRETSQVSARFESSVLLHPASIDTSNTSTGPDAAGLRRAPV